MDIRLIKQEDIDKVKWNSCVHYANNGNIFGYKWYLDHVAKDWDGLVEGDYESVFPLVWRKGLWGGKVLYQPDLMRELGIYTINAPSSKRIKAFLAAIPSEYKQIDIVLNEQNHYPDVPAFDTAIHTNHQLLLARPFEELEEAFAPVVHEAVEKATQAGIVLDSNVKPETIADFYKQHSQDKKGKERNFHTIQRIMYNVLHRGWGFASAARSKSGELLAVNFFIYSHNTMMSLVPLESPAGREVGALTYLFQMLIRTQANRPLILDFNTMEPDALAEAFGAQSNPYLRVKRRQGLSRIIPA